MIIIIIIIIIGQWALAQIALLPLRNVGGGSSHRFKTLGMYVTNQSKNYSVIILDNTNCVANFSLRRSPWPGLSLYNLHPKN